MRVQTLIILELLLAPGIALAADLPEVRLAEEAVLKASCAHASRIPVEPFTHCERMKEHFLKHLAHIKKLNRKYEEEFQSAVSGTVPASDIDRGAQCAVTLLNERAFGLTSTIWTSINIYIGESSVAGELFGDAKHLSFQKFRESSERAKREGRCSPASNRAIPECSVLEAFHAERELKTLGNVLRLTGKRLRRGYDIFDETRNQLKRRQTVLAEKYQCASVRQAVANKAQAAARMVARDNGFGSGSFVKTTGADGKSRYHFVTAEHVLAENNRDVHNLRQQDAGLIRAEHANFDKTRANAEEPLYAVLQPGRIDRSNDSLSVAAAPRAEALPVVESDRRPSIGQEFQLTGFPAVENGEYTSRTCTFVGYGMNHSGKGTSYYLDCPGAEFGSQAGASGGALVDQEGKVWGVYASSLQTKNGLSRVSPVSADRAGNLVYGIQQTFVSDFCVDPFSQQKYRCQIIPGYTNQLVGP